MLDITIAQPQTTPHRRDVIPFRDFLDFLSTSP
jgi:hypothetical protein